MDTWGLGRKDTGTGLPARGREESPRQEGRPGQREQPVQRGGMRSRSAGLEAGGADARKPGQAAAAGPAEGPAIGTDHGSWGRLFASSYGLSEGRREIERPELGGWRGAQTQPAGTSGAINRTQPTVTCASGAGRVRRGQERRPGQG